MDAVPRAEWYGDQRCQDNPHPMDERRLQLDREDAGHGQQLACRLAGSFVPDMR